MDARRRIRAWRSLPRRERARISAVCAATVVAAAASVAAAPGAFRSLAESRDAAAALSEAEREVGALYVDVDTEFLLAARRLLPEDARYAVRTGDDVVFTQPVLAEAVHDFTRYFLLPRRQAPIAAAEWLLCYGCEDDGEGARAFQVVWAKAGIVIGRYG